MAIKPHLGNPKRELAEVASGISPFNVPTYHGDKFASAVHQRWTRADPPLAIASTSERRAIETSPGNVVSSAP